MANFSEMPLLPLQIDKVFAGQGSWQLHKLKAGTEFTRFQCAYVRTRIMWLAILFFSTDLSVTRIMMASYQRLDERPSSISSLSLVEISLGKLTRTFCPTMHR